MVPAAVFHGRFEIGIAGEVDAHMGMWVKSYIKNCIYVESPYLNCRTDVRRWQ